MRTQLHRLLSLASFSLVVSCSSAPTTSSTLARTSIEDQAAADLAWISDADRQSVIDYAKAGSPVITRDAADCDPEHDLSDRIGAGEDSLCLTHLTLPRDILAEVLSMEALRFKNESDYDSRVTKLYVFKHHGTIAEDSSNADILKLAKAFGIPEASISTTAVSLVDPDDSYYLDRLRYLATDGDTTEETILRTYVKDFFEGASLHHMTVKTPEITLYPGGGFNTTYQFIFDGTYVIYIKYEWWNA